MLAMEAIGTLGRLTLRVSGTSMVPAVLPGDIVSVERTKLADVAPKEIIVFAREGRLIVHRVVAKLDAPKGKCLITRGDRTHRDDGMVSGHELIGRVTCIKRGPRHVSLPLRPKFVGRALRLSDRATRLYLRLIAQ